jgi:hypothetical protein
MRKSNARYALALGAAAAIGGCAALQTPGLPHASYYDTPTNAASAAFPRGLSKDHSPNTSEISPDAVSQALLYVSDERTVTVYSYPLGKLEETLKHFYLASGMCVDNKGDVFIVDTGYGKIFEYAHGGTKRVATLTSPTRDPVGCSVDPTTGNLAVTSLGFGSSPTIAIFKNARGKPTIYDDSAFYQFYFCSYDNSGNLFADGLTSAGSGHFGLTELPKGKTTPTNLSVSQYVSWPGGVEWDGKHVLVGDQNVPTIYQLVVKGRNANVVGSIRMRSEARTVKQFWMQDQTLIAPNEYLANGLRSDVLFFKYLAGGRAFKKIRDGVAASEGAVVSLAASEEESNR